MNELPLVWIVGIFAAGAALVVVAGAAIAPTADRLADRTGLGEAFVGALFVGGSTSLPGIVVSVVAATEGRSALALGNAVGGIAAQTAWLALADLSYRQANLEHAAASLPNILQGTLLLGLLSLPLVGMATPGLALLGVHPASLAIVAGYILGLRLVRETRGHPMWRPRLTRATRPDRPDAGARRAPLPALALRFALLAALLAGAGLVLERSGVALADRTVLSETAVGTLFTAVSTSLPELVTALACVRAGALTLAVGTILGGNAFDVMLVAFSDAAYPGGSVFRDAPPELLLVVGVTQLMTALLLLGMLRREKHGIANIGFESFGVLVIYAAALPAIGLSG